MKWKRLLKQLAVITATVMIILPLIAQAKDPEARKIMDRVDARYDGEDMQSNMKMILIDKQNRKRIREVDFFTLDHGEDTWKMLFFSSPVDVKGTGFLTYDYDRRLDDDQWLYLPALHKSKRIASEDKTSSFMGSDFSYADMTSKEVSDYYYTLIKETNVRGNPCWMIESVPKTEKIVSDYGYTKAVLFVRKDCYMVVRSVNWVKEGGKLKYMDVKQLKQINGVWTALETHMTTKKGKIREHTTILTHRNVRYNKNLGESLFSLRQLEKGI